MVNQILCTASAVADPSVLSEIIQEALPLLIAAVSGAILTYFSKPLTERRIAKIRIAEKFVDIRASTLDQIWSLVSELDKSKVFHDSSFVRIYAVAFPFAVPSTQSEVTVQKIFLTHQSFVDYTNRYAAAITNKGVLLGGRLKQTLINQNAFFQYLVHIIAQQATQIHKLSAPGFDDEKTKEKLLDSFVFDIGVICFNDINKFMHKAERQVIRSYYNPSLRSPLGIKSILDADVSIIKRSTVYKNKEYIIESWEKTYLSNPNLVNMVNLPKT